MNRRLRNAKIIATLGPASSSKEKIKELFLAGADVFRLNFSHGTHADHTERLNTIREVEKEVGRPIGVLLDLQGPKLRVGTFAEGKIFVKEGDKFRFDMTDKPGDQTRVMLRHPEIFAAIKPGTNLLVDDGKVRVRVDACGPDFAETTVIVPGAISDRKGVNVPDAVLPISPLTEKDRKDLDYALGLGVDWVALSFVQRPEDIIEAREIIGDRAWIMAKLEKPMAMDHLEEITRLCDGIMVARGDLGVEMPPEYVPEMQRRMVSTCRRLGKPVVIATQMLESMINSPVPTRAEASDVATAIYEGSDTVMLSAESASGNFPVEAISMMDRIIKRVEQDPIYQKNVDAARTAPEATVPDAVCGALGEIANLIRPAVTITYTSSGFTALRAARERPATPIIGLTPDIKTARRLTFCWGVHPLPFQQIDRVQQMVELGCDAAKNEGFAKQGDHVVIIAGLPFGQSGTTNLLHIAKVE